MASFSFGNVWIPLTVTPGICPAQPQSDPLSSSSGAVGVRHLTGGDEGPYPPRFILPVHTTEPVTLLVTTATTAFRSDT